MKKLFQWLFILVPIFLLGMILVKITGFHLNGIHPQGGQFTQQFGHGAGHHFVPRGAGRFHEIYALIFPITMLFILAKIALVLAGLAIWKFSKEKTGKWFGGALFSLALFTLLPKIFGIPFLIIIAYLGYKGFIKKNHQSVDYLTPADLATASSYQTRDYLDEWEKSIRKEEV
ncbi:MAG: hypothetical protein ACQEXB_22905 [Bacillota bacterium]